jgi:WD40 repeat protein
MARAGSSEEEDELPYQRNENLAPSSPLFRPANLRCVNTLSGHHSGIRAIAIQQRTNRVFTGSYDNTIKVWNLDGGSCEATLEGHAAWIRSLYCHSTEPLLFSGSDDGEIKVWRTDDYRLTGGIHLPDAGGVLAITVDYENAWLLGGCYHSSIHVGTCHCWRNSHAAV